MATIRVKTNSRLSPVDLRQRSSAAQFTSFEKENNSQFFLSFFSHDLLRIPVFGVSKSHFFWEKNADRFCGAYGRPSH